MAHSANIGFVRLVGYFAALFLLIWLSDVAPMIGVPLGILFVIIQFVSFKGSALKLWTPNHQMISITTIGHE